MSDIPETLANQAAHIPVRTNLLVALFIVIGVAIITLQISNVLRTVERIDRDAWRLADQREWAHRMKESNPNLTIPDPASISVEGRQTYLPSPHDSPRIVSATPISPPTD